MCIRDRSFYIKSTSARSNVGISISTRDNAGGTNSVTRASGVTFNSTTSWTRVEKTFTLSGTVGGSNACLQFEISLAIGDKVTGFQLEKNSFATDFEHLSYADELRRCERYYQDSFEYHHINASNGESDRWIRFRTEMRASPTVTTSPTNSVSFGVHVTTSNGFSGDGSGNSHANFNLGWTASAEL